MVSFKSPNCSRAEYRVQYKLGRQKPRGDSQSGQVRDLTEKLEAHSAREHVHERKHEHSAGL